MLCLTFENASSIGFKSGEENGQLHPLLQSRKPPLVYDGLSSCQSPLQYDYLFDQICVNVVTKVFQQNHKNHYHW